MKITLALGGARSGKSTYALHLAERLFRKPLYLATAEAGDTEMTDRIKRHRKSRGSHWKCVEEPVEIASVIKSPPACDGILLDCLTLWVSNILLKEGERAFARRTRELIAALRHTKKRIIIVSNEVGMGVVPEYALGRKFRDLAGRLNQQIAAEVDTVVFVTAGLPMTLKGNVHAN